MNRRDKLLKRFYGNPKDFTFDELKAVFSAYGFRLDNKGATSGSRVEFVNDSLNLSYIAHKPHPGNTVKAYAMRQAIDYFERCGLKQDSK